MQARRVVIKFKMGRLKTVYVVRIGTQKLLITFKSGGGVIFLKGVNTLYPQPIDDTFIRSYLSIYLSISVRSLNVAYLAKTTLLPFKLTSFNTWFIEAKLMKYMFYTVDTFINL